MVNDSIDALKNENTELAESVKEQEQALNRMEEHLRAKHMERLNSRQCSPEFTVIYTDVIHNIEKRGDSCDNIANVVLDGARHGRHEEAVEGI